MQSNTVLSRRLESAVPYIRSGARVADVGTDHAYLPIRLVESGIARAALAADINRGPIESARANIARAGLDGLIETLQTDGLHGVEAFAPDHVIVFGMGGELIERILSEADWIKTDAVRLILQPMSRAATLRAWLTENGFTIVGETLTYEEKKYYQTFAAEFCGERSVYSEVELAVGRLNIARRPPIFEDFLRHEIAVLDRVIAGKNQARTVDATEEIMMKRALEELL